MMHTHSSSDGWHLRLTDAEQALFKEAEALLYIQFYLLTRAKRGIWAGNQGEYVATRAQLNDWDSKFMEDQVERFL